MSDSCKKCGVCYHTVQARDNHSCMTDTGMTDTEILDWLEQNGPVWKINFYTMPRIHEIEYFEDEVLVSVVGQSLRDCVRKANET